MSDQGDTEIKMYLGNKQIKEVPRGLWPFTFRFYEGSTYPEPVPLEGQIEPKLSYKEWRQIVDA